MFLLNTESNVQNMRLKGFLRFLLVLFFYNQFSYADGVLSPLKMNLQLNKGDLKSLEFRKNSIYQLDLKYGADAMFSIDSSNQVSKLIHLADLQKNNRNYNKAYDYIWDAQLLAESTKDTLNLAECHNMLGMLYGIFSQKEEAVHHMKQSLRFQKVLVKRGIIKERDLGKPYFAIAVCYRQSMDFEQAGVYLDSCLSITRKHQIKPFYILAEKANILIHENKFKEAEKLLHEITPFFESKKSGFIVMIYSFYGRLKAKQELWDASLRYYTKCLKAMGETKTHTDLKPEILHKLAKVYDRKGMAQKAYVVLSEAKAINDSLFSVKNNSELLEVKNKYREVVQQTKKEIAGQKALLQKRQEQNFRLKVFLGIVLLLIVTAILLVKNWYQRRQYKDRQYNAQVKAKLEKEKQEEVITVKNKEITSYTLQLIDKERVIDELLSKLKVHLGEGEFRRTQNTTKDFNKNLWNEFNERFTRVNSDFYQKIRERFPSLSPTELKHCALIKLNFNGKEMAQLLNISLPSVHIARHRLRKKFNLERQDNLAKFIGDI